jgi:hypothetical protein
MADQREHLPIERFHTYLACCRGKEAFESRTLAEAVNRRRRASGKDSAHAYKCSGCGKYHIGRDAR